MRQVACEEIMAVEVGQCQQQAAPIPGQPKHGNAACNFLGHRSNLQEPRGVSAFQVEERI